MKAFVIHRYSKKDTLQEVDLPEPKVSGNDVLVQIHATAINQLDIKLKSGAYKLVLPYKLPLVLGHDAAGIVTQVGPNVSRFKVGDEVYARPSDFRIGTFAEYIAINENDVAMKPKNISMEEAASLPLVALTVWQAFVEKAHLQKGNKVFIQAGSGGVGTIAIQLAKHLGASVATTTSAKNFDLVKALGADVVIDYKTLDFETLLSNYDVVLNSQDEMTLEKSLRILKPGGIVLSLTGPPDVAYAKEIGLPWWMRTIIALMSRKVTKHAKRLGAVYSFLFMRANGQQLAEITSLVEAGKIYPVVDKVFLLDQINEAMAYTANGHAKGKVVVKVR
ncbi:MAG: NADP-dependent oxidoreductase [Bacteroidetes bacterium]|jgi:NADPH:quinone reductase-like Zn-dependent oxidoreductase|nr:NADP-dependent oxidoreductase [Bacteroidota bacterium]